MSEGIKITNRGNDFQKSYYQALYDSIRGLDEKMEGIEIKVKEDNNAHLRRVTWVIGLAFTLFIAITVFLLNANDRNSRELSELKGKVNTQGQTLILQYDVYKNDYQRLKDDIEWLKANTEMKKRGEISSIKKDTMNFP